MNEFDTGRAARARLFGRVAAAWLFAASLGAARAEFTLDDIHFWVGEGTNRAAVVVDWSADGASPLAWGYRWNGEATLADALVDILREDNRLHALAEEGEYGLSLYAMGYDRADVAATFIFDFNGGDIVAQSSDAEALVAGGWNMGYWAQWFAPVGDSLDADMESLHYGSGLSATPLEDRSWHVLQFQRPEWGWPQHPLSGEPGAAESPYAWRVAAADVAGGGSGYGNPANALGGPSRSVPGWGDIPPTTVNPVSPAWAVDQLVTLASATNGEAGGSITVEFDHGILDDPRNPYGLDFIVFGNAMQTLGGDAWFDAVSDPAGVVVSTDTIVAERGLVEVSADGVTWFSFANGPWADDFAPTLSHRYDPENPDRSLFGDSAYTNEWWGAPTDATRPLDPALTATDFKGRTLAEIAGLYGGSAGGTGFDISGFDLPCDGRGRKYVRFVRITTCEPGDDTEVDAVADVSPLSFCHIESIDPATGALTVPLDASSADRVVIWSANNPGGYWTKTRPLWTDSPDSNRLRLGVWNPTNGPSASFFWVEVDD